MLSTLTCPHPVSSTPLVSGDTPQAQRGRRVKPAGEKPKRRYYCPRGGNYPLHPPAPPRRPGGSWQPHTTPPASLPCWLSRKAWLTDLANYLTTPEGEQLRRTHQISTGTLLDIAEGFSTYADTPTGRNVYVAHATIANRLTCSEKTVQRGYHFLLAAHFAEQTDSGRYLTSEEREQAQATHGKHQTRIANTFHCVQPRACQDSNVHLPSEPLGSQVNTCLFKQTNKQTSCLRAATRQPKRRKTPTRKIQHSLAVQKLAAALAQRMPWLARGHIGHLCQALYTLGLDANTWTAAGVLDRIEAYNQHHHLAQPNPDTIRNPLGLFIHQARQALFATPAPPTRQQILTESRQRQQQRRHQWDQQFAAAATPEAVQNHVAAIRKTLRR